MADNGPNTATTKPDSSTPPVPPTAPVMTPEEQAEYNFDRRMSVVAFVLRCTIAGVVAYMIPKSLGFDSAVWGSMAAVHVAREPLTKTHKETFQRVSGTILGSIVGVSVMVLAGIVPISMPVQIGLAVAICSLISAYYPLLHISMWICLAVMLKSDHAQSRLDVGLSRCGEVIFGAFVAVIIHTITVHIVRYIRVKRGAHVSQEIIDQD